LWDLRRGFIAGYAGSLALIEITGFCS